MAKYPYNVNNQTKIIDIQKQFPGGLKTVDTDDALGKVYLRQADNVSLSEFSFLEKRHGSYIEHIVEFNPEAIPDLSKPIQGYFEYNYIGDDGNPKVDKLLFIDGNAYIKQDGENVYFKKTTYFTELSNRGNFTVQEINGLTANIENVVEREVNINIGVGFKAFDSNFVAKIQADPIEVNLGVSPNVLRSAGLQGDASVELGVLVDMFSPDTQVGLKTWVVGGAIPSDLTLNLGEVETCPTTSEALALVETNFPVGDYSVGTTASVNAFRDVNGNTQICEPQTFIIELTQGE